MLTTLARASVDGAILVALVWIATRVLRLSARVRTIVWWCVAARFVVAVLWPSPVAIPVLPAAPATVQQITVRSASPVEAALGVPIPSQPLTSPVISTAVEWGTMAMLVWISGLLLLGVTSVRRWRQTLRVVTGSAPAPDHLQAMASILAGTLGLRRVPAVRVSDRVDTPLVAGLRRPVILLPAEAFDRLTAHQQRMAICHELAHVKRADLWLGCVPALAERMFFFHPLAHVASREYALWREAACDAAVIEALDVAPQEYGRLLLDLGVSRPSAGLAAAGASWSFSNLKRRIAMLHDLSTGSRISRLAGAAAIVLSLAAIVPMKLVARATPGTAQAPAVGPFAVEQERERSAPPETPQERKPQDSSSFSYVLLFEDNGSVTTSGSSADVQRARGLKRAGEPMVWIRQGEREYVIRDPEVLGQIKAFWSGVHHPVAEHAQALEDVLPQHVELAVKHALEAAGQAVEHIPERLLSPHELGALHEAGRALEEARIHDILRDVGRQVHESLADVNVHDIMREATRHAGDALNDEHVQEANREAGRLTSSVDKAELDKAGRILEENLQEEMDKLRHEMRRMSERLHELRGSIDKPKPPMEDLARSLERAARGMADHAHEAESKMRALIERAIGTGRAEVIR